MFSLQSLNSVSVRASVPQIMHISRQASSAEVQRAFFGLERDKGEHSRIRNINVLLIRKARQERWICHLLAAVKMDDSPSPISSKLSKNNQNGQRYCSNSGTYSDSLSLSLSNLKPFSGDLPNLGRR